MVELREAVEQPVLPIFTVLPPDPQHPFPSVEQIRSRDFMTENPFDGTARTAMKRAPGLPRKSAPVLASFADAHPALADFAVSAGARNATFDS